MKKDVKKLSELGTQTALAERYGTNQPQISRWVRAGAIVVDGRLYTPVYYTNNNHGLMVRG